MKKRAIKENKSSTINLKKPMVARGQSLLEYAMIVSAVVAALSAMTMYVRRAVQANLKLVEVQVNENPPNMDSE
jgi:hypothetical protein